jgi:hypothetical protein
LKGGKVDRLTEAEQERAIKLITLRINNALSVYAAAVEVDEGDEDFGISMLPVSVDEGEGELEVHYKDTIDGELPDGIFQVSVSFAE